MGNPIKRDDYINKLKNNQSPGYTQLTSTGDFTGAPQIYTTNTYSLTSALNMNQ